MKITRPIRAVLFDMDGVMVDSEFVYMKYLLEFAREKNPAVTMEDINPMVDGAEYARVPLGQDRKSTRLNSSHIEESRMPSSA